MSAELFLNTLFHNKPGKDWILIWEKHPEREPEPSVKISYWFDHVAEAIKHFIKQGTLQDTYVGCGTSNKALPTYRRCKAEEISGIPGVWLDIDILNPAAHTKSNLPENETKALEIISSFPLKPTMIVHSGHGFQFWWVFDIFASFKSQRMREEAADLVHAFTWTMRDVARSMGYDLDMTFDLSRVFRIPGGRNFKSDPPAPVTLKNCNRDFYSFIDFNNALQAFRLKMGNDASSIEERKNTTIAMDNTIHGKHFVLDPQANPPQIKLKTLLDYDQKFRASWEHRRNDFKKGDDSASVYDLSLASFAFSAGWDDQEVVDLLIAFRRNNNLKPKLIESYYKRTLTAASNAIKQKESFEALETATIELACAVDGNEILKIKETAKQSLTQIFGIPVQRILKYPTDPVEYKLELEDRCIHLGPVQYIIEQPFFKRKFADIVGKYLVKMKEDRWKIIADAMLAICEDCPIGDDTTTRGLINYYLQQFLDQYIPLYDRNEGLLSHRPFFYKDSLYITGPDFRKYIGRFHKENITMKAMGIMLKDYGFQSIAMSIKKDNRWLMRSAWKIEIAKNKIAQYFVNADLLKNANEQYKAEEEAAKETPSFDF